MGKYLETAGYFVFAVLIIQLEQISTCFNGLYSSMITSALGTHTGMMHGLKI